MGSKIEFSHLISMNCFLEMGLPLYCQDFEEMNENFHSSLLNDFQIQEVGYLKIPSFVGLDFAID